MEYHISIQTGSEIKTEKGEIKTEKGETSFSGAWAAVESSESSSVCPKSREQSSFSFVPACNKAVVLQFLYTYIDVLVHAASWPRAITFIIRSQNKKAKAEGCNARRPLPQRQNEHDNKLQTWF